MHNRSVLTDGYLLKIIYSYDAHRKTDYKTKNYNRVEIIKQLSNIIKIPSFRDPMEGEKEKIRGLKYDLSYNL